MRLDGDALLGELTKLDDHQLGRFLTLCSFAHYGAPPNRSERGGGA